MSNNFKEIRLSSINQIVECLLSYERHWLFRGHGCASWSLESTLERLLQPLGFAPEFATTSENYSLSTFKSKAHHYITGEPLPESKLGWLSLMQHHGVPTRLLDFTTSPFVALFFAFDNINPNQIDDCAVWAIDYRGIMKSSIQTIKDIDPDLVDDYDSALQSQDDLFENVVDRFGIDVLWITEPSKLNLRLERQGGTFLLSGNPQTKIVDLIDKMDMSQQVEYFHKIIIPSELMYEVYKTLNKMGIDNSRLYPGIDGLSKDIKNELRHQISKIIAKHR